MTLSARTPSKSVLPLLDTDVVRTFVAIAENGSFTRAAQQMFRTPAALSMQIKRLEATLGQPLFVREARQVRLTPEGEVLLGFGRRMLKLNEEAVSQFLVPALEGTVRFGMPDDVGTRILPTVLAQFARSHPAVAVDVVLGRSVDIQNRLNAGELDLILMTAGNPGQDPNRGEVIHTEPLVWVCRSGGLAPERSPLPIALASPGCCWRTMALTALDRAGIAYRVAYTSEHCAGQEAAMEADLAVAPLPQGMIRPPFCKVNAAIGLPTLGEYQILLDRHEGLGPAAEALAGHITETFSNLRR